jgi:predicted small secreted protein
MKHGGCLPSLLALSSILNATCNTVGSVLDTISKGSQSITEWLASVACNASHGVANLRRLSAQASYKHVRLTYFLEQQLR